MTAPDPFTVAVVGHGLAAAAEEMSALLVRSARSPLLREAGDLSSVITDAAGELAAQGRDIPVHLGAMAYTVKDLLRLWPAKRMRPGDVLIYNLPGVGGNHLNDVKAVRPVFVEGQLVCFALSLAHWPDVGGTWPGSYYAAAADTFSEALRIPPVLLQTSAGWEEGVVAMIRANVRDPVSAMGDLQGQVAATAAAERRIRELCAAHGTDIFEACLHALQCGGEAAMRAALLALPDGTWEGEDRLDEGARVHVRVTVAGDEAVFDLRGSDDAVPGFCNTTPYMARSAVAYAARVLTAGDDAGLDMAGTGGALRPLKVLTRPGSLLDPGPGAAVAAGNHETSQRVADAIFRALERAVPERLTAGGPATAGLLAFAEPRGDGTWRLMYEVHGGGEGARHDRDGCDAVRVHLSNTSNTPAEVLEAQYGLRVERQALRPGSGGAGRHRGGDGLVRAYRVLAPRLLLTTCVERVVVPPYGLCGGAPGLPFRITLERDGVVRELPGKANLELLAGDLVTMESCGGGGYGVA